MTRKLLGIFPHFAPEIQQKIQGILEPYGGQAVFMPKEIKDPERESYVVGEIGEAEMLVTGSLSETEFHAARNLRWLHVPFAGINRLVENRALVESDVIVTNAAGVSSKAIADQVLGYMIMHSRGLVSQLQSQSRKEWQRTWFGSHLFELDGRTVGIVGHGRIGREIAIRARAFGMRVIATKTRVAGEFPELDLVLPSSELPRLLAESDYVVIAAPLTPETRGLIGRAELEQMKRTGYLINIARGLLIKENELIEALQEKIIDGAALDVFEVEPLPPTSPLWELPNVVITPHSSGTFNNFMEHTLEFYIENLKRWLEGQPLQNIVDKRRGY